MKQALYGENWGEGILEREPVPDDHDIDMACLGIWTGFIDGSEPLRKAGERQNRCRVGHYKSESGWVGIETTWWENVICIMLGQAAERIMAW